MAKRSETDIARPVVEWLRAQHWTVYQEVSLGYAARVIDIVAIQPPLAWCIEVKSSLSMDVISQAFDVKWHASFVSVAVPKPSPGRRQSIGRVYAERCMGRDGIGLIHVSDGEVTVGLQPELNRRNGYRGGRIENYLNDAQKHWAPAGNATGDRWSPFQETCRNVLRYVTEHPGVLIREVFEHAEHHYGEDATARACLLKWARAGKVKGVRCERDGRYIRLYPISSEEPGDG